MELIALGTCGEFMISLVVVMDKAKDATAPCPKETRVIHYPAFILAFQISIVT
jgi:hypothetical protein